MKKIKAYLKLMRVKHYIKNVLVFFPLFFGEKIFDKAKFTNALLGFIAFSLIASVVYIVNDISDVDKDRRHPTKKNRPIASGAVSIKEAVTLAVICCTLSLLINIFLHQVWGVVIVLLYLVLNIAYSRGLKNIPLVDVVILVSGFLLRVIYGAVLTDINISSWLYLTVISGSFFMGLGKRRNEMVRQGDQGKTRIVLKYYSYDFLDKNMYVCLALTEVFYALWTVSKGNSLLVWTVPLVIIILMKYSLSIEGNSDGDPIEVILHDKWIILMGVIFVIMIVTFLYLI